MDTSSGSGKHHFFFHLGAFHLRKIEVVTSFGASPLQCGKPFFALFFPLFSIGKSLLIVRFINIIFSFSILA